MYLNELINFNTLLHNLASFYEQNLRLILNDYDNNLVSFENLLNFFEIKSS